MKNHREEQLHAYGLEQTGLDSITVYIVNVIMVIVNPKMSFTVKYGWNRILSVFLFSPSGLFDPVWCRNNKWINPYPTAFPYGNGMVLHFYQQQESSTTKTVHSH